MSQESPFRRLILLAVVFASLTAASRVEELTDDTLLPFVVENEFAMVAFYAPWCGHCKRLHPEFERAANELGGRVAFGQIDATAHGNAKSRFQVDGYPTVLYFERSAFPSGKYNHARSSEALVQFGTKMTGPAAVEVSSMKQLKQVMKANKVAFGVKRSAVPASFDFMELALQLRADHTFMQLEADIALGSGVEDGELCKLEYQEAPKCATLASLAEATQFVLDNQFETLVALGPSNFFATAHSGRHLAMLVLDVANSEARLEQFRGLARNAGQEHLPAAVHQKFVFGYLDGNDWSTFVSQFNVQPSTMPHLVVFDSSPDSFYEDAEVDEVDEMATFLTGIATGVVPIQRRGFLQYPTHAWNSVVALTGSPIIAAAVLGAVCLALMFALFMCCSSVFGDSEEDLSTEPQRDGSDADAGNAQADSKKDQ